ncbi:hypothetical protein D0Y65_046496 [Glycine soja]|uniref:Endonuclease/exonuclease/phosphatase domain-containing protein n=1 Tax=Glycine soja TaxID=3848 RepID=A0A445G9Q9_GLYSO|nr:hypothetical protein D0Y65_046496 [Glycine soja]
MAQVMTMIWKFYLQWKIPMTRANQTPSTRPLEGSVGLHPFFFTRFMMSGFNDFSIFSWNVREASIFNTWRKLRDVIKGYHPSMFVIYETKDNVLGFAPWYMPLLSPSSRNSLHLIQIGESFDGTWIALGDLNEVLSVSKTMGSSFSYSRATTFSNCINVFDLMDINTMGGCFTWRRHTNNGSRIRKKLDCCLANSGWSIMFPHVLGEIFPTHGSYHNSILVSFLKPKSKKFKVFHYQTTWVSHLDYAPLVANTWVNIACSTLNKLGVVKDESIKFNVDIFGNIFRWKCHIETRLSGVHKILDNAYFSDLVMLEKELQKESDLVFGPRRDSLVSKI